MRKYIRASFAIAALAGWGLALSQETARPQPGTPQDSQAEANRTVPAAPIQSNVEPLTVGEKFRYRLGHAFDPLELARMTISAGFDHWRKYPEEWGSGWDAYGVRFASMFGQHLVKEEIMFGIEAIDHEDPRRPAATRTTLMGRIGDAIKYTYVTHSDSGRLMPRYSRFVGDYGAAFISRQWYPSEFHTLSQGLTAGTNSLLIDAGMNVLKEIIRTALHRN